MAQKKINYLFVGLGNPGIEFEKSRHSFGRQVLLSLTRKSIDGLDISPWQFDKKLKAQLTDGRWIDRKFKLLLPENFMNNSGATVKPLIKTKNEAHNLVVIHDDIDLPLGVIKISFNRGAGGHRGVESIAKSLKTKEFIRLRLGIAPTTKTGRPKKPNSDKVVDFVIGNFRPTEELSYKKVIRQTEEIIKSLIFAGLEKTMNCYN